MFRIRIRAYLYYLLKGSGSNLNIFWKNIYLNCVIKNPIKRKGTFNLSNNAWKNDQNAFLQFVIQERAEKLPILYFKIYAKLNFSCLKHEKHEIQTGFGSGCASFRMVRSGSVTFRNGSWLSSNCWANRNSWSKFLTLICDPNRNSDLPWQNVDSQYFILLSCVWLVYGIYKQ